MIGALRILLVFLATVAASAAVCGEARWIAYPGDHAIWWGNRVQARRVERGAYLSPFWPQYAHQQRVWFKKSFRLDAPESVRFDCEGHAQVCVTPGGQVLGAVTNVFTVPAGTNVFIRIGVENAWRPPAIRLDGPTVKTDASWLVEWHPDEDAPAEELREFTRADTRPGETFLRRRPVEPVSVTVRGNRLLADFGCETYGYLKFRDVKGGGRVRVVYGESEAEALDDDPMHCDSWEILEVPAGREYVAEIPHGFRYVRVIPVDEGVCVGSLAMDYEWRDLPHKGAFHCSDERLNRIWQVADRTLELTCREVFIEGVKRDHWVWSGDAVQSCLMAYYRNGDYEGAKRTLWCVRGKDPVVMHLNSIVDYTFYWLIAIRDFDLYAGDADFLRQVYPRMRTLLDFVKGTLDRNGRPAWRPGKTPYGDDWVFIDWSKDDLHVKEGVCSVEMVLYARALEAAASVADRLGLVDEAVAYRTSAVRVKADVMRTFWNEKRGALMHLLRFDGTLSDQLTSYPNLFALAYGYFDADKAKRVFDGVIRNKAITTYQTPYMRFYEMDLLCEKGCRAAVLDDIRAYWGGMLDKGATSFWERYDPNETGAEHYAMYARPYARSLCHAWGASPLYLIGRHFLGVRPTASGFSRYVVAPHPCGLAEMDGAVPTPQGCVRVSVKGSELTVTGCPDGVGEVVWLGEKRNLAPNQRITMVGSLSPEPTSSCRSAP